MAVVPLRWNGRNKGGLASTVALRIVFDTDSAFVYSVVGLSVMGDGGGNDEGPAEAPHITATVLSNKRHHARTIPVCSGSASTVATMILHPH